MILSQHPMAFASPTLPNTPAIAWESHGSNVFRNQPPLYYRLPLPLVRILLHPLIFIYLWIYSDLAFSSSHLFIFIWILNFTKTLRKHRKNNSIPPFLSKKVIIISLTHSQENFPLFADFNEQVGRHYRYQRQVSMDAHRPPLHFPKKTDEARENLGRNRAKILRSFFSEIYEHQLVLGIWCSSTKEKMCIYKWHYLRYEDKLAGNITVEIKVSKGMITEKKHSIITWIMKM